MLNIAQVCSSQVSRTVKLQKEEASYYEVWPIKNRVLQNFKSRPSSQNCLGFQSNTTRYKRKTLITFYKSLEFLWVTPMRFVRFLYLLTQQVSTGTRDLQLRTGGNKLLHKDLLLMVIWNFWVGSQSYKLVNLCSVNLR